MSITYHPHNLPDLPDVLTEDDGGFVHFAGSRVGLNHLINAYNDGCTVEKLPARFDTLKPDAINTVVDYYETHTSEVDGYIEEHDRLFRKAVKEIQAIYGSGPSLSELRARLAAKHRAARQAVGVPE